MHVVVRRESRADHDSNRLQTNSRQSYLAYPMIMFMWLTSFDALMESDVRLADVVNFDTKILE